MEETSREPALSEKKLSSPSLDLDEERSLSDLLVSCFYIGVFCLVGLPIWWKTTTITRVSVPFDEIDALIPYSQRESSAVLGKPAVEGGLSVEPAQRWKTFWNLPATTGLDIVFTLVNPSPAALEVRWNAREELPKHLDPVLSILTPLANFTVSTQVLRYMDEDIVSTLNPTEKTYSVTLREASKIINNIESRLGRAEESSVVVVAVKIVWVWSEFGFSSVEPRTVKFILGFSAQRGKLELKSNVVTVLAAYNVDYLSFGLVELRFYGTFSSSNRVLNYIIYVPSPAQYPLSLVDKDGKTVPTSSFVTPRWGGVQIYSPASRPLASAGPVVIDVDTKAVVPVFLSQLFVHLGLFDADQLQGDIDLNKDVESLMIKRAQLNIDDSISTLKSLARLLNQMSSIAINHVVGQNIYDAVHHVTDAKQQLETGNYVKGLLSSRKAWEKSERAFYDPSLLEQLYFPDDQKFAIYVPLFVPACLPVAMSAWTLFGAKFLRRLKRRKTEKLSSKPAAASEKATDHEKEE